MSNSKGEAYFIDKLKAQMGEDGRIASVDKETRTYLKNRYHRMNMRLPENEQMHSIAEMIAKLIPGAIYVTNEQAKKQNFSNEAILSRLEAIAVEVDDYKTGKKVKKLDFGKDEALRSAIKYRAEKQGVSVEEILRGYGCSVTEIYERAISVEEHIANIRSCVDRKGNIVNLAKTFPSTHHYLSYLARKNKCSYTIAVNQLLNSPLQEYTYVGIKNKLSKYDKENPAYIGSDKKFRENVFNAVTSCMDENGVVNGFYRCDTVYKMLIQIAKINGEKLSSVISEFVPNAIYIDREEPVMKHQTKKDVLENLKRFDDGSGCIDSVRANKTVVKALRKFAKDENLHMSEFVEKYTNLYFSACSYEIDYIDYVIKRLVSKYGVNGEVYGLSQDDPQLYYAVHRIKKFFPGGAKKTMEDTFMALGFQYRGIASETKFTESYVRGLLETNFGKEGGVIESIYDLDEVGMSVIAYSGIIGKSVKDTLEYFGFQYVSENPNAKERLTSKKMSLQEYKKYKQTINDEEEKI
ncbi:MAG: hypothetical protein IKC11_01535 [Clostridia bacterium]|nr:hypothetical protein [Clostridia bacterium]